MGKTFRTIEKASEGIYKEKGSKFLAFAHPVCSESDVRTLLESSRKKFYDARHVCYAFRIGAENPSFKYSDDGEPSGTAGKPIYGQLLSCDVTNVLVVVVRYFGGIKLGTGGLVAAYREAAADALRNNEIVEKDIVMIYGIEFSYENMDAVMRIIKTENIGMENPVFDNVCRIRCIVPKAKNDIFLAKISDFAKIIGETA